MNDQTRSQSIVAALNQLHQFLPYRGRGDEAICALTGVRVVAQPDADDERHEMILVTFPGAEPVEMLGSLYLELQIIESTRIELDSAAHGTGRVSDRAREQVEHFRFKYDLD